MLRVTVQTPHIRFKKKLYFIINLGGRVDLNSFYKVDQSADITLHIFNFYHTECEFDL